MESFLKSEIARLVYGYLVDECCHNAAQAFLETSAHLEECLTVVKKGRRFGTKKCGKSLIEILEILADVTCLVQNFQQNQDNEDDFMEKLTAFLIFDDIPTPKSSVKKSSIKNINDSILETPKSSLATLPVEKSQENSDAEYDERPGLQALLENTEWHERLAENINKVVVSTSETNDNNKPLEKILEKKTVENIVTNLEADPMFEEILNELVGPRVEVEEANVEENVEKKDFSQPKTIEIPSNELKTPELVQTPSPNSLRLNVTSSGFLPTMPQIFLQATANSTSDHTVLTTANPIVAKHLTTVPSPLECSLFSQITTQVQGIPKVFFKKDPYASTPKIHMKTDNKTKTVDILPKQIEPKSEQVIIKRSGVRTRGGKRPGGKVQTRLKVTPAKKPETRIEVVILNEKPPEVPTVSAEKPPEVPTVSAEKPEEKKDEKKEEEKNEQEVVKEDEKMGRLQEMTPVQVKNNVYKKRMSLSSPRRSHVRTLDFKTPPKTSNQRKALTSPKNMSRGPSRLLKNVKRGCLFKSPSPPLIEEPESEIKEKEVKEKPKKAWDADLRVFTENIDIPTSVGLQRKNSKPEEKAPEENRCVTPTPNEFLKNMSPVSTSSKSPGNLERTLIKECQRIENFEKQKLTDEEISLKILEETSNSAPVEKNKDDVFQTPAKPILPNVVEMTPLSKIRLEISELGKTKLLTPTLPQTPISQPPEADMTPPSKEEEKKPVKKTRTRKPRKTTSPKPRNTRSAAKNKAIEIFDVDKTIAECLEMAKIQLYKNPKKSSEDSEKEASKVDEEQRIKSQSKITETKNVEKIVSEVKNVPETKEIQKVEVKVQEKNVKTSKFSKFLETYSFGVFCEEDDKTIMIKASPFINLFESSPEKKEKNNAGRKDEKADREKTSRDKSSDSAKREKEKKDRGSSDSERKRRRSYSSDEENETKRSRFYNKRLSDYPERRYRREWKVEPRRRDSYYAHKRPRHSLYEERRGKSRLEERLKYRRRKGIYTPSKNDIKSPDRPSRRRKSSERKSYESNKSEKRKSEERRKIETVKEEGELSDTSCSFSPRRKKQQNVFSRQKSGHRHSPSVADDNRTSLLKELDVESFLSLVHGKEANKPL